MSKIAVMGAGAWGTALAINLAQRGGHSIMLWAHDRALAEAIRTKRENSAFLPGFPLPSSIAVTGYPGEALKNAEIVLSVMPSHHVRESYATFAQHLREGQVLVSATKGIEDGTGFRMSEAITAALAEHELELPIAVLSGPSFAQEVASGSPTAVTIASRNIHIASRMQKEFAGPTLRLYTNEDVAGVELGGALKNVIAVAAGAVSGLELGHNSTAALVTRGIAEMTRLAVACGGRRETLAGLSGLGDLVLTCTGSLSRNRWLGTELGKGKSLSEALNGLHGKVAEGVRTTSAALELAARHHVEMPIAEQVHAILYQGKHPSEAIQDLMGRPGRDE